MSISVKDIMTPDPACCTPNMPLREVARLMVEHDCGEIPVVASDSERRPIGVITDRDIVIRTLGAGIDPMTRTVADCMSTPCITVTPDTSLEDCCDVMESHQIRRVPVVEDDGNIVGIVALADIVNFSSRRTAAEVIKEVSQPHGKMH